ncbi:MAG: hypothetical protein ACOCVI_02445 [Planctomycetota bacterium]
MKTAFRLTLLCLVLVVVAGLTLPLQADPSPKSFDRVTKDSKGRPVVHPPQEPGEFANPWPKEWEDDYRDRVAHFAHEHKGKASGKTTGEHEKWGLPDSFGAYIAGDHGEAIKAMQAPDNQGGSDHSWTKGMDFYWCFTLKGQAHKYFQYGDLFDRSYLDRMYQGAKIWTDDDPRPSMEVVLSLESNDEMVRKYAKTMLQKFWRSPAEVKKIADKAIAEGKANSHHKNKIKFGEHMHSIANKLPASMPTTTEGWKTWWKLIAGGGWMVFEEYERRCNPFPHPKYGNGTGPVGAAWDPKVRGMRADARNTDNLRGMRECAVYLFAEETGNEDVRRLYKDKIMRTAVTFWNIGNGEWDSEGYLAHTMSGYSNLYAFAKDKEVRGAAKAILDYLFLSAAKKYYRGAWGGPVKRDYGNCAPWSGSASMTWIYFGAPVKNPEPERDTSLMVASGYRPPAAIVSLARKEFARPVEVLSSHPTYETWLPWYQEKPYYFETMYYGNTYQLGTTARAHEYNMNGYKLLLENSEVGADYFIPCTYRGRLRNPVTDTAGGDNVAQYRNLTIWLNGREGGKVPFAFLLPRVTQADTEGGVTFLKFEKTYLALHPIHLKFEGTKDWKGKRNPGNRLHLLHARGTGGEVAGFACEIGEDATHGSYAKFKAAVKSKSRVSVSGKTAELTGAKGGKVKMEYTGSYPKIWRNGKEHSWTDHYKLFQPADGSRTPCYLGWKERKMHVEAGGHVFTGELSEDGKYTFKSTLKK